MSKLVLFASAMFIFSPAFSKDVLKTWDCEKLIAKSKDEKFVLNNLAALYANRNCKDFIFESKNLSALERKIFKVKFDELDESKKTDTKDTDTVESLRLAYKNAIDPAEKFEAFKKLRQKYRASNRKDDSFKLIKSNHAEIEKLTLKQIKSKKPLVAYYDLYIESTQILSKAFWNDEKLDQALKTIETTIKNLNNKRPTYSLHFLNAKIQEDKSLFESAVKNYDLAVTSYNTARDNKLVLDKSFDVTKATWAKAWIEYRTGTDEAAAISLKNIADTTTDVADKSRALFFLSKVYKKLKKTTEASLALEDNIKNDFFSFYALASYHELGRPLPAVDKVTNTSSFLFDSKLSFLNPLDKDLFLALIENEEIEMADRATVVLSKNNTEYVNLGLNLAESSQYFLPLFFGFAKLNSSDKKDVFIKHARLIFPEVHADKVNEMSKKTSIEKSLIYSIMKQESSFNPDSRSHADAMGLMQVIPRLAKSLAKKHKIENFKKTDDLYNPLVNIELGTYELKDQVEKQNGQLSFVASAYNAGPGALRQWRNKEPIQDMFEFIENIPYDETRTYVKIIARNMLFYQRLARPDQEHVFPTEFVKIIN